MRQNNKHNPERERERGGDTYSKDSSTGRIQHTYTHTKPSSLPSVWIMLHLDQHSVDAEAQGEGGPNPKAGILYRQMRSE